MMYRSMQDSLKVMNISSLKHAFYSSTTTQQNPKTEFKRSQHLKTKSAVYSSSELKSTNEKNRLIRENERTLKPSRGHCNETSL
jgi:hypothetical protein